MCSNRRIIVAIDGYSSCGKSTFAKAIAAKLGYIFIDTGAMYRAVTLAAIRANAVDNDEALKALLPSLDISFKFNDKRGASDIYLNGERVEELIRSMEVNERVSDVSTCSDVRHKLVAIQQQMGERGGIVMDGRDIGTVVFPNAEIKIFMLADPRVRAERRYNELLAKGSEVSLEQIVENVEKRDRTDETRAISPLRRADDAIILDNSAMTIGQQMEWFDKIYSDIK